VTKVLVVDDEVRFGRALAISLRARGYDVDTASTGEDASAARSAGSRPSAAVTDSPDS